jgi:hypothetical protein
MSVKKHAGGRPTKYNKKYCKMIVKYFDILPYREVQIEHINKRGDKYFTQEERANDLPTIEGFARLIKVDRDTVINWTHTHKEFFGAYKRARTIQEELWKINSFKGLYNSAFTIFAGKNMFGWRDKQDVDHTSGGKPLPSPILQGVADVRSNDGSKKAS